MNEDSELKSFKNAKILIYGAGGTGVNVKRLLEKECIVLGFLDKRAGQIIRMDGLEVYDFSGIRKQFLDCIVIVTVKNVFVHDEIVRDLLDVGFRWIIYKPGNILRNCANEKEKRIDVIFEAIVEKSKYIDALIDETVQVDVRLKDQFFISQKEGMEFQMKEFVSGGWRAKRLFQAASWHGYVSAVVLRKESF